MLINLFLFFLSSRESALTIKFNYCYLYVIILFYLILNTLPPRLSYVPFIGMLFQQKWMLRQSVYFHLGTFVVLCTLITIQKLGQQISIQKESRAIKNLLENFLSINSLRTQVTVRFSPQAISFCTNPID